MTKEMYLALRSTNSFQIVYEFYKEHFESEKHKRFLSPQEFMGASQTMNIPVMMETAIKYYDDKFGVTKVFNKDGGLIKVI